MSQSVMIELNLPADWRKFRWPPALEERLQELLDRQDRDGRLALRERREGKALVELVDLLTLIKAKAQPKRKP